MRGWAREDGREGAAADLQFPLEHGQGAAVKVERERLCTRRAVGRWQEGVCDGVGEAFACPGGAF